MMDRVDMWRENVIVRCLAVHIARLSWMFGRL
jgi:hypothetical protein